MSAGKREGWAGDGVGCICVCSGNSAGFCVVCGVSVGVSCSIGTMFCTGIAGWFRKVLTSCSVLTFLCDSGFAGSLT
ncbi:MAG: hypothetical protein IKT67_06630 [Lachnospiraceae bacterium]|nr:hypothetical protein [Lachnospiraceae bacterium]